MSQIAPPRKNFQFALDIDGVNQFEIQDVDLPEVENDIVYHGDTNHDVPTAGKVKYTKLILKKVRQAIGSDTWAMDWITTQQDPYLGGGALDASRTIVLRELAPDGVTTLNTHIMNNCVVAKVKRGMYKRVGESENQIEEVEIAIERMKSI